MTCSDQRLHRRNGEEEEEKKYIYCTCKSNMAEYLGDYSILQILENLMYRQESTPVKILFN
jgi:hypothetical protein